MEQTKPKFGTRETTNTEATPTTDTAQDNQSQRQEMGALWKRVSKTNAEYFSVKLAITKEKLKELLTSDGEVVTLNLVAFENKYRNGDDKRPNFRIYESTMNNKQE